MREDVQIARDLLDKQLVDATGTKMGRVDGMVMLVGDGPPKIDRIELGFEVLARRIHPRAESWLHAIRKRWSVRKQARQIVSWARVLDFDDDEIKLDIDATGTPAFDWEQWLRDHVIARIPGSGVNDD